MSGGTTMVAINSLFSFLSDEDKKSVNSYIGFLYHTNNETITKQAVNDALSGNTVGPFDTIEDFMNDLYEED